MPNTENLHHATVLMRFLPWSSEVPLSYHVGDDKTVAGSDPLDEPLIIDIDPHILNEDD